jgi:uncharacterized membrane protein YphA (DoxX/SURF4 family)
MNNPPHLQRIAAITLRVALALSFLSAVADRFGLWGPPESPNVAWGTFDAFLEYTGILLGFLPSALVPVFGWITTILEVVLAIGLLSGYCLRWFALASSLLLFTFATSMTFALGFEPAFSYSVWTASASAFLLAYLDDSKRQSR